MVTELRTDSSDYRTELLSPDLTGETVTLPSEQAWRLNMDGFKLPAERNNMDSFFGFGNFVKSLSRQRKVAQYYRRQNRLLKGFNELDSFSEMGFWPGSLTEMIDHNVLELEAGMRVLVEEASSLGIPIEFNMISEPVKPSLLTRDNLDLREGEALFINSIMHLHKYVKESRGSLKAILQALKKLGPSVLTVVEQDANHNGPFFLGRFLESLHFYSAIFDSLEVSLPRNSPQRMKIERLHFADEIRNIVAFEGLNRVERHERADQWRRQLGRAGFQVMGLKCTSQARMMLSVYGCDGYSLASEKGCLLLGWKGRPIMLSSAWQVNNASSSWPPP